MFASTGYEEEKPKKRAATILALVKKRMDLNVHTLVCGNVLPKKTTTNQLSTWIHNPQLLCFSAFIPASIKSFSNRQPALCISLSGGRSLLVSPVLSPRPSYTDTPLLPSSFRLPAGPCDDYAALCPSVDPHQRQGVLANSLIISLGAALPCYPQ